MKKNVKVTSLTKEELVTFFSDATYGCQYWSVRVKECSVPSNEDCIEGIWADCLLNGGTLSITDNETEEVYEVKLKDVLKGFSKGYSVCPQSMLNFESENTDMWDGYNIMQAVLFGEIIYG